MDEGKPLSAYMSRMLDAQETLIRAAAATQRAKDEYHMATRAVEEPSSFPVGSYVLVTHPKGRRSKLQTFKEGPFQVVNVVHTVRYDQREKFRFTREQYFPFRV
jgi:hypothetical protein